MKLLLLDRDGVINIDRENSVRSQDDFVLLPDVVSAIKLLNKAQVPIAIVTNQAVVGRGELSIEELHHIHAYFEKILEDQGAFVNKIYCCTSADPQNYCRKPNPGLLVQALNDFKVKPENAILIGDDLRDLEAAKAIECHSILVRTGKGRKILEKGLPPHVLPVRIFNNLYEAVVYLLQEGGC